jgi:type I restriction enzyme S subunit
MIATVKPGYKQTEVGVIPENWEVKTLGYVLSKGRLGGNYANQDAEAELPLMKMGNLARGYFDLSKVQFITPGLRPELPHRLVYGDVLFNTRNTLDLVGKVAIWRDELPVAYYNSNLMRLEFHPEQVCSNEYANYALNTEGAVSRLRALATGTTSVAAIYTRDLMKLQVLVPPLPEQLAIAEALSDVDGLLGGLDRLIAKKRDLKQAAMQQLLTGQTRLPGFHGDWEVKRLDAIADVIDPHPSHRAPDEVSNGVPFVGIGDLDEDGTLVGSKLRYVDRAVLVEHAARYNLDDQLIGLGRVASIGKVVCLKPLPEGFAISPTLGVIRGRIVQRGYLLYALRSKFITEQFTRIMSGSTRSSVGMEVLRKLDVLLPPTPEEQTAIAEVLSEMDGELAVLEQRREKTGALKQAMMQELLTGRTRLV